MARTRKTCTATSNLARRRASMTDSATLEDQCHQKKVFVGGLGQRTTTQTLLSYFGRYGSIVDAVVLRWPDGQPRGFGYVTFVDANSVTSVLKDTHKIAGSTVDVKRAVPGTNKLFVGGLPQSVSAAEMREHFETFGVVSDAVVMMDPATNRSRGFGFVCFSPGQDGAAAVNTALEQYDCHFIRGKWIEVKSAAPPRKLAVGKQSEVSDSAGAQQGQQCEAPDSIGAQQGSNGARMPFASSLGTATVKATVKALGAETLPPPPPPELSAPPGLGAPTEVHCPGPRSRPAQDHARTAMVGASGHSTLPRPNAPLPSLLVSGQWGHPCHSDPRKSDAKARLEPSRGSKVVDCGPKAEEISGVFDASMDLRRSLEQLLREQLSQCRVES